MNWLVTGSCAAETANFGWLIGAIAGTMVVVALILAIGLTPRLREHGEAQPQPDARAAELRKVRARARLLGWGSPALVTAGWLWEWRHVGGELLSCYAPYGAVAAAVVIGAFLLVIFPLAAAQIAQRSIW